MMHSEEPSTMSMFTATSSALDTVTVMATGNAVSNNAATPKRTRTSLSKAAKEYVKAWLQDNGNRNPNQSQKKVLLERVQAIQGGHIEMKHINTFCQGQRTAYLKKQKKDKDNQLEQRRVMRQESFRILFPTLDDRTLYELTVFCCSASVATDELLSIWAQHVKQDVDIVRRVFNYCKSRPEQDDLRNTFPRPDSPLDEEEYDELPFEDVHSPALSRVASPVNTSNSTPNAPAHPARTTTSPYQENTLPTPTSDSNELLPPPQARVARTQTPRLPLTPASSSTPIPRPSLPPATPQPSWTTIEHPKPIYALGPGQALMESREETPQSRPAPQSSTVVSSSRQESSGNNYGFRRETSVESDTITESSMPLADRVGRVNHFVTLPALQSREPVSALGLSGMERVTPDPTPPPATPPQPLRIDTGVRYAGSGQPLSLHSSDPSTNAPVRRRSYAEGNQGHPTMRRTVSDQPLSAPADVSVYQPGEILSRNPLIAQRIGQQVLHVDTSVSRQNVYPTASTHNRNPEVFNNTGSSNNVNFLAPQTQPLSFSNSFPSTASTSNLNHEPSPVHPFPPAHMMFFEAIQAAAQRSSRTHQPGQNFIQYVEDVSQMATALREAIQRGALREYGIGPPSG